ncbi:MAG TPA: hypothetical protein VFS18_04580, partial [Actinomycetota bacterium]|nr:hypothetical protein [Actinomycetota bacterium]
ALGLRAMEAPSVRTVGLAVAASVAVTAVHYTDNYVSIDDYPQPGYINQELVALAWILLTLIGVAGYLFYRDRKPLAGVSYLLVYSYTGLSSLGHYAYGSSGDFTTKMHVLIWTDGIVGAVVALCALWILVARFTRREQASHG